MTAMQAHCRREQRQPTPADPQEGCRRMGLSIYVTGPADYSGLDIHLPEDATEDGHLAGQDCQSCCSYSLTLPEDCRFLCQQNSISLIY